MFLSKSQENFCAYNSLIERINGEFPPVIFPLATTTNLCYTMTVDKKPDYPYTGYRDFSIYQIEE